MLERIERVKELILYDEMCLTEIGYQMGPHSCVQYIFRQVKKAKDLHRRSSKRKEIPGESL